MAYLKALCGALCGISTGIGYTATSITPYHWLDKKRAQYGPLILWGASLGSLITGPLTVMLISIFTWSGAALIFMGIVFNQWIISVLYMKFPEHQSLKELSIKDGEKSSIMQHFRKFHQKFLEVKSKSCFFRCLILNVTIMVFLTLPITTQITNIMTERGVNRAEVTIIWTIESLADFISRPMWAAATRCFKTSSLIIINTLMWTSTMIVFLFSRTAFDFCAGMILFGISLSGYNGFKIVFVSDIVGVQNLQSYIVVDQLFTFLGAMLVPSSLLTISVMFEDLSLIFKITSVIAICCVLLVSWISISIRRRSKTI